MRVKQILRKTAVPAEGLPVAAAAEPLDSVAGEGETRECTAVEQGEEEVPLQLSSVEEDTKTAQPKRQPNEGRSSQARFLLQLKGHLQPTFVFLNVFYEV